jgi:hypothetical protein
MLKGGLSTGIEHIILLSYLFAEFIEPVNKLD